MYEEIRRNKQKTLIIVSGFSLIIILVCAALGQLFAEAPLLGALIGAVAGLLYTAWSVSSASRSLIKMANGRQITADKQIDFKDKQVVNIVSQLAMMAHIPEPDIYIIPDDQPNAFAGGLSPEKAVIGVTTGLLERLNRAEIESVLAHEIAHIRNYDTRLKVTVFALGAFLVGIGSLLMRAHLFQSRRNSKEGGVVIMVAIIVGVVIYIIGGILSKLTQLWVSRNREYLADATATELTRNPEALVSALTKISNMEASEVADKSMVGMYFVHPFKKGNDSLFSTHPSTANRIKRLKEL